MLFIKKGINKARDKYIYPHPTQTNVGNCGAYTGAACLYAFGLDHDDRLLRYPTGDWSEERLFQWRMGAMVEQLTDLCYTQDNSIAEGYRQYLVDRQVDDKFEVTEQPLTLPPDPNDAALLGGARPRSRMPWLIEQMKQCQDIMLHIRYHSGGDRDKDESLHSVGLVGVDEDTGELLINNPWGFDTNLTPEEAATGTTDPNSKLDGFTRVRWSTNRDGETRFPFDGDANNTVYQVVMICPVERRTPAARVRGESERVRFNRTGPRPESAPPRRMRYSYTVGNAKIPSVSGFAIQLPGLTEKNVVSATAPEGWSVGNWYREPNPRFDYLAPELHGRDTSRPFAGMLWQVEKGGIRKGGKLGGFTVEVDLPEEPQPPRERGGKLSRKRRKDREQWVDDPKGHAVLLHEMGHMPQAWHVSALTPRKRPPNVGPAPESQERKGGKSRR